LACEPEGVDRGRLRLCEAEVLYYMGENERRRIAADEALALLPEGSAEHYRAAAQAVLADVARGELDARRDVVDDLLGRLDARSPDPALCVALALVARSVLASVGAVEVAQAIVPRLVTAASALATDAW